MHNKCISLLVLIFNSSLLLATLESYITGCMCIEEGEYPVMCVQAYSRLKGQQLTALFANWVSLWPRLIRKLIACDWKERESQKSGQGLHIMNIAISLAKSRSKMVNKDINLSTCLQHSTSILAASITFRWINKNSSLGSSSSGLCWPGSKQPNPNLWSWLRTVLTRCNLWRKTKLIIIKLQTPPL